MDRLNDLADSMLEGFDGTPLDGSLDGRPEPRADSRRISRHSKPLDKTPSGSIQNLRVQYIDTVKKSSYKTHCRSEAWRCIKCNVINGMQGKRDVVRRTCQKCGQYRDNPITFLQELELQEIKRNEPDKTKLVLKIAENLEVGLDKAFEVLKQLDNQL